MSALADGVRSAMQAARAGRSSGPTHDRQGGQVIVLFALALVVILVFASVVVDLGVNRNNRQILVNTLDAAALAGGTKLPVAGAAQGAAATALINQTVLANYPSLSASDYTIEYKCLIGVVAATGQPRLADLPLVCDPHFSLGHTPTAADFKGAGNTRYSSCNPSAGDTCNTVVVSGSALTSYGFGRVVGVNQGSTGAVNSAACNGPCGASPATPVDVVLIMDRTLSMSAPEIADIQSGANTVLSVFTPSLQRIALGTIGPSQVTGSGAATKATCPSGSTSPVKNLTSPNNQVYGVGISAANNVNWFSPYVSAGAQGDLPKWIPVGFSGTDGATPAVTFNEAYSSNGVTNTNSTIWKAVSCFYSYTQGTNLDTPVSMALKYLQVYGRPGVKKGIIMETDGAPQAGDGSTHYTCNAASNTATAAKAAGVEMFTIGFGIGSVRCPYRNSSQPSGCSGTTGQNTNETSAWSCHPVSELLLDMASPDQPGQQHFFDAPDSATLISAFQQAAQTLAGTGPQLIQLYPPPVVNLVAPAAGVPSTAVTITGKYFSGATSVRFGSTAATFTVVSDTSITVTAPVGPSGTVDVVVTTPGGVSKVVSSDHFTYN
jgi:IPT/TIG domain/Putative Flp pilus-assembly TadE/G-like/von Willebrand factor type A domain